MLSSRQLKAARYTAKSQLLPCLSSDSPDLDEASSCSGNALLRFAPLFKKTAGLGHKAAQSSNSGAIVCLGLGFNFCPADIISQLKINSIRTKRIASTKFFWTRNSRIERIRVKKLRWKVPVSWFQYSTLVNLVYHHHRYTPSAHSLHPPSLYLFCWLHLLRREKPFILDHKQLQR